MTKEWESFKSLIVKYYETYPLNQVREIMRNDHGFDASIRSYREKLRKWGVYKYSLNRPKNVGGGGGTSQVEAAGPAESVSSMEVKVDDDAYGEYASLAITNRFGYVSPYSYLHQRHRAGYYE